MGGVVKGQNLDYVIFEWFLSFVQFLNLGAKNSQIFFEKPGGLKELNKEYR